MKKEMERKAEREEGNKREKKKKENKMLGNERERKVIYIDKDEEEVKIEIKAKKKRVTTLKKKIEKERAEKKEALSEGIKCEEASCCKENESKTAVCAGETEDGGDNMGGELLDLNKISEQLIQKQDTSATLQNKTKTDPLLNQTPIVHH